MKQIWHHLKRKWIKYFFETVAIIIGIFGAFTLDTWNQRRIDKIIEIQILKEIKEDLFAGLEEINFSNNHSLAVQEAQKIVIHQMTNDLPYHDSLNKYFYNISAFAHLELPSSGFETLKSKGFELVSNSYLRRHLIQMFDQKLPGLSESLRHDATLRHEQYLPEYIEKFSILSRDLGDPVDDNKIIRIGTNSVAVPVNYNALLKDQRYENYIRELYNNSIWMTHYKNDVSTRIKILIDEIEVEIALLE